MKMFFMVILNVPFLILALVLVNYDNSGEYYIILYWCITWFTMSWIHPYWVFLVSRTTSHNCPKSDQHIQFAS